jgi:hypothetical protein
MTSKKEKGGEEKPFKVIIFHINILLYKIALNSTKKDALVGKTYGKFIKHLKNYASVC